MKRGYFCTVKFFHNPIRDENINIGIILFLPSEPQIYYKVGIDYALKKINAFFTMRNNEFIRKTLNEFIEAIEIINKNITDFEDPIEELRSSFKSYIKLSKQRTFMVENIDADLNDLYEQQVS